MFYGFSATPGMPQDYLDAVVNPTPQQLAQEQAAMRMKGTGGVVVGLLIAVAVLWRLNK